MLRLIRTPAAKAVILVISLLILIRIGWSLTPEQRLKAEQQSLLELIDDRAVDGFLKMAAQDYSDQWGHRIEDVPPKLRQIRLATGGLEAQTGEMVISRDGDEATVTIPLTLRAKGGPYSSAGDAERLTGVFRWRRDGWFGWKIVRVESPDLAR